ncbi:hypothetical protein QOZ80_7BG0603680 [Eleusine coracana subsp. coracana]|nr:hypothetical protein QOZ80_7BG0603680 [Eleusine coracana subsp. coracana]
MMTSPETEPVAKSLSSATTLVGLADDLIADILLRLPTLADVGRAATICRTFRRVIADRSFRRRLRSIHRPHFLGFFDSGEFYPAEAPYPSAPYARAFTQAADLSFSFVPLPYRWCTIRHWHIMDFRDGRALLKLVSREYVVADPVSRKFVLLPPLPVQERRRQHLQPLPRSGQR